MKPPIHTVRFGLIEANVWRNHTKAGDRHSVTVVRLYKNGDVWSESTRFGRDDLPLVCKVLEQAHTWIYQKSAGVEAHKTTSSSRKDQQV